MCILTFTYTCNRGLVDIWFSLYNLQNRYFITFHYQILIFLISGPRGVCRTYNKFTGATFFQDEKMTEVMIKYFTQVQL